MHEVSFNPKFEQDVVKLGFNISNLQKDLKLHLDSIGSDIMPIHYLGKTDPLNRPQTVVDANIRRIHVYDTSCANFNSIEQKRWNSAKNLRSRTSDTYFLYTVDFFNEHRCYFLGILSPAHEKAGNFSGKHLAYFVEEANKFNGM